MAWNDAKYDAWKLASPYDNDNSPEIFETSEYILFSCYENNIELFDDLIEKAKNDPSIYLNNKDYDLESLEHYKDYLVDDEICGVLHSDEHGAIEELENNYIDEKEYALEQKYQAMKDDKLTGDN